MRRCGAGADVAIEVEVETRIEGDVIGAHLNHMDLVIALCLHNSSTFVDLGPGSGPIFLQSISFNRPDAVFWAALRHEKRAKSLLSCQLLTLTKLKETYDTGDQSFLVGTRFDRGQGGECRSAAFGDARVRPRLACFRRRHIVERIAVVTSCSLG